MRFSSNELFVFFLLLLILSINLIYSLISLVKKSIVVGNVKSIPQVYHAPNYLSVTSCNNFEVLICLG